MVLFNMFTRIKRVFALLTVACSLSACFGNEGNTKHLHHIDIPIEAMEAMDAASSSDLKEAKPEPSWRFWKPWKFWQWVVVKVEFYKHNITGKTMYYVDPNKSVTRRGSSMIVVSDALKEIYGTTSTLQGQSTSNVNESSQMGRPNGSVQREIISLFFESMLEAIVLSWEVIELRKPEDTTTDVEKTASELTLSTKKKKSTVKQSKTKKSRSGIELSTDTQVTQADLMQRTWWTSIDERAIIHFRNGNIYEGQISMKTMHGEGRFQWADGTIYLGQFKNNEICGKGIIQFKDDTWYEGDFSGNLRHGKGLYVDSRSQCSYAGYWDRGTKNGTGIMYYSKTFQNLYDGEWCNNVRHGFGSREYCSKSGYKGYWDNYIREGNGFMIWPNNDLYRGGWKNNVMSGYGTYIWNACNSNSMSLPSLCMYRGNWECGKRHGNGLLDFGFGMGSHYEGGFKHNRKHGAGRLVTNNGLILQHKPLFIEDNISPINYVKNQGNNNITPIDTMTIEQEPLTFDMCNKLELSYHIKLALQSVDRQHESRSKIINDYIENNYDNNIWDTSNTDSLNEHEYKDLTEFEINSLRKSLMCYETLLSHIYYQYAIICNEEDVNFEPVLIRLYLWQLYYDCNIHCKLLTLIAIDNLLSGNPDWLANSSHNPFDEIYFWQFIHSLISVATHLYGKKHIPDRKPDTMVASAFRLFMEEDVIPGIARKKGRLTNGYGKNIPLKSLYKVYDSLGDPCTIRDFICAIHYPPHEVNHIQWNPIDYDVVEGRNYYTFENDLLFVNENPTHINDIVQQKPKMANLNNVPTKTVINIFKNIFPQIFEGDIILNLNIELTFFEFFEAFVACAEESVKLSENREHVQ